MKKIDQAFHDWWLQTIIKHHETLCNNSSLDAIYLILKEAWQKSYKETISLLGGNMKCLICLNEMIWDHEQQKYICYYCSCPDAA